MIKYMVVSGVFTNDGTKVEDKDFVYGIESFPSAQDIQAEKRKEYDYSFVDYYRSSL